MTPSPTELPPIGAILAGPHWPDRVRVVRVEPRGESRVLIEAVILDGQDRLISRLFKRSELAGLHIDLQADQPTLAGNPAGFRLAAEATRIRLAYTYDPQFAVSLARIDPLPHQPRLRFLLTDDPGAGKTIGPSEINQICHIIRFAIRNSQTVSTAANVRMGSAS
jgi:hypothetical protein